MKFNQLQALESYLSQTAPQALASVYLVASKDDFDRDRAFTLLRTYLLKGVKSPELSCRVFDGESTAISSLIDELQTPALFSPCKLAAIRRVDQLSKSELKVLEESFALLGRGVRLLMTSTELAANTTFYKKAEQVGVVIDLPVKKPAVKEGELVAWVEHYGLQRGKRIPHTVSQLLVKQLGDGASLRAELDKLLCYVGDRDHVTLQDVTAICTVISSETIWQLGEALLRLDASSALRIGSGLLDSGSTLLGLVAQMRFQLQTGYQIASLLHSGAGSQEVTRCYPYLVGGLLDKQCRLASAYGMTRFKAGLLALAETEFKAKDSTIDPERLLERLLLQLTR